MPMLPLLLQPQKLSSPREFEIGKDRIPASYVYNRPFHRALNGLMIVQASLGQQKSAILSANEQLEMDPGDRMGVRMVLPHYYLEDGQPQAALKIFERKGWEDSFEAAIYHKAYAMLSVGRMTEGREELKKCLTSYPQVGRYILNPSAPQPPADTRFGIEVGSEYEGWYYGRQYAAIWWASDPHLAALKEAAEPFAAGGWKRNSP